MLYQKRLKRAMNWLGEKNENSKEKNIEENEKVDFQEAVKENHTEIEHAINKTEDESILNEEYVETKTNEPLEKNDRLALMLSAFIVFLPFVLIVGVIGAILIFLITLI